METSGRPAVPSGPIEQRTESQDETKEVAQVPPAPTEIERAGGLAVTQSVEVDFGEQRDELPQARRDPRTKGNPEDVADIFERTARPQRESTLTLREQQVIALAAEGLENKEIAGILGISATTVKSHFQRIGLKLGTGDRTAQVSHMYEIEGTIPAHVRDRFGLTDRVAGIIELAAQGLSNAQIGRRLFISENTVKTHISGTLRSVGARGRTHLVTIVYGLVGKPEDEQPDESGAEAPSNQE